MMWPFRKPQGRVSSRAVEATRLDTVGQERALGEAANFGAEPTREVEPRKDTEPIPEGEGEFAVRVPADERDAEEEDTPEYIFGRMDQLNPYCLLSWLPMRTYETAAELPPIDSEQKRANPRVPAPRTYKFRGASYRLKPLAEGGLSSVYRGELVTGKKRPKKAGDRPATIIFKATARNEIKDVATLQEIALMAALHPDPKAPEGSFSQAVRWAGRAAESPHEVRRRMMEDANSKHPSFGGPSVSGLPLFYEALGYRIGNRQMFGIVMEDLGSQTYQWRMRELPSVKDVKEDQQRAFAFVEGMAEALEELSGIAQVVAQVHARGIVHRDLKPENIFQRDNGTMVLADIGIGYHPYYRGREFLAEHLKPGYDAMRAYGAALYGLLQEHGLGFDPKVPEGEQPRTRERTSEHLSKDDELMLWEVMRKITSAVYTAEVSDQERLDLLQMAYRSAKGTYVRMKERCHLAEIPSLSRAEHKKFLNLRLAGSDDVMPPKDVVSDVPTMSPTAVVRRVEELDPRYRASRAHATGTPMYMSPEQARGRDLMTDQRRKTDVFALGVMAMQRLRLGKVSPLLVETSELEADPLLIAQLQDMTEREKLKPSDRVLINRALGKGIEWWGSRVRDTPLDAWGQELLDILKYELMVLEPNERPEALKVAATFREYADRYRELAATERARQAAEGEAAKGEAQEGEEAQEAERAAG